MLALLNSQIPYGFKLLLRARVAKYGEIAVQVSEKGRIIIALEFIFSSLKTVDNLPKAPKAPKAIP